MKVGPSGEWTVEMKWDDEDRNGPSRLEISPTDSKNRPPGGLSQTVLREIDVAGAVKLARKSGELAQELPEIDWKKIGPLLADLSADGISSQYLAVLALAYSAAANRPKPLERLADLTGKSQSAIKSHLWQATRQGLLERSPGRAGGAVTTKAVDLISQLADEASNT
jgi:DNA-binding MarR family transcriptional regulator